MIGQAQVSAGKALDLGAVFVVGVGAGFEVGATLYNLTFETEEGRFSLAANHSDRAEPFAPLLLATAQKVFRRDHLLQFSLGAQVGRNLAARGDLAFVARGYALAIVDLQDCGRCTIGPYVGSQLLLGNRQHLGGFMGCEVEVVPKRFGFEIEWDAGANALGKLSVGPRIHLGRWGALSIGGQIPNAWGTAAWRAVAQLEATFPGQQE